VPGLYWEMAPNTDVVFQDVRVRTNGEGFRSAAIGPKKVAQRIVVLGDSITFGARVAQRETYTSVLGRLLNAEAINCGVSGYNLVQSVINYRTKAAFYDPGMVVLGLFGDDFFPPYLPREKTARLWLTLHSRLFRRLAGAERQAFDEAGAAQRAATDLRDFAAQLAREKRELLIVVHPNLRDGGPPDPSLAHRVMEKTLAEIDAPVLQLSEIYRATGRPLSSFSVDPARYDVHPSAAGHRLIAEAIARELAQSSDETGTE